MYVFALLREILSPLAMIGPFATAWTIRLALLCYAAYVSASLFGAGRRWPRSLCAAWTAGWALFVVHVGCAFHFYHGWSHQAAWEKTAAETEHLLGFAFGDGIYFSYLFLVLWTIDLLWLWIAGSSKIPPACSARFVPTASKNRCRTPVWRLAVHGFLLFIAINGAIVFESGVTRFLGIPVVVLLGGLAVRWAFRKRSMAGRLPSCEIVHEAWE